MNYGFRVGVVPNLTSLVSIDSDILLIHKSNYCIRQYISYLIIADYKKRSHRIHRLKGLKRTLRSHENLKLMKI